MHAGSRIHPVGMTGVSRRYDFRKSLGGDGACVRRLKIKDTLGYKIWSKDLSSRGLEHKKKQHA